MLTNSLTSLGRLVIWVSRSATWTTLTPSLRASAPHSARLVGLGHVHADIGLQLQQRGLDEIGHEPGIGAMGQDGGGIFRRQRGPQRECFFAHRVVGATSGRRGGVRVAAGPGLDAGVDVHDATFPAVLDERHAGDIHRKVHEEIAAAHEAIEHAPEILAYQRLLDEPHAQRLRLGLAPVFGGDDHDALGADVDMPQDQRQHALSDAAEADHDEATGKLEIDLVAHGCDKSPLALQRRPVRRPASS